MNNRHITPAILEGNQGAPSRRHLRRLIQAVEAYIHHPYIIAAMNEDPPSRMTWEESQDLPLDEVLATLGDELHAIAEALESE